MVFPEVVEEMSGFEILHKNSAKSSLYRDAKITLDLRDLPPREMERLCGMLFLETSIQGPRLISIGSCSKPQQIKKED